MSNLLRRLRKLEAQLIDHSGLIPHTEPWRDYWSPKIESLITGEVIDRKIPLEVVDALVHGAEADGHGERAGLYQSAWTGSGNPE